MLYENALSRFDCSVSVSGDALTRGIETLVGRGYYLTCEGSLWDTYGLPTGLCRFGRWYAGVSRFHHQCTASVLSLEC